MDREDRALPLDLVTVSLDREVTTWIWAVPERPRESEWMVMVSVPALLPAVYTEPLKEPRPLEVKVASETRLSTVLAPAFTETTSPRVTEVPARTTRPSSFRARRVAGPVPGSSVTRRMKVAQLLALPPEGEL